MSIVAESGDGILRYGEPNLTNELLNDSKQGNADPVAYRGGTHEGGTLRKDSADRLVVGQRLERVAVIYKEDPDGSGRVEFYVQGPGQNGDMNASHLRLTLCHAGVILHGPVQGLVPRVSRFYTDDGRYCYNFQGPASGQPAGAGIKYDTHHSTNETTWTAVGRVAEAPL